MQPDLKYRISTASPQNAYEGMEIAQEPQLAAEQQMYGAEYVRAIFTLPPAPALAAGGQLDLPLLSAPAQQEVERDLVQYEQYVANRDSLLLKGVRG